jgi:hypothetical protein
MTAVVVRLNLLVEMTRHPLIQTLLEFFLAAMIALGILSSTARASSLRIDAELETSIDKDATTVIAPKNDEQITIQFKNGAAQLTPFEQTDKTVHFHIKIFGREGTSSQPLYNSTFLTNLNMDAEIRETRLDGTLLYKLKINPHPNDR